MVEFAVCFPFFLMLCLALLDLGFLNGSIILAESECQTLTRELAHSRINTSAEMERAARDWFKGKLVVPDQITVGLEALPSSPGPALGRRNKDIHIIKVVLKGGVRPRCPFLSSFLPQGRFSWTIHERALQIK